MLPRPVPVSTSTRSCPPNGCSRQILKVCVVAADPEGYLLELSTGMDISGRRTEDIPPDLRAEVLDVAAEAFAAGQPAVVRSPADPASQAVYARTKAEGEAAVLTFRQTSGRIEHLL